jgi:hypothetical protein
MGKTTHYYHDLNNKTIKPLYGEDLDRVKKRTITFNDIAMYHNVTDLRIEDETIYILNEHGEELGKILKFLKGQVMCMDDIFGEIKIRWE